MTCTAQRSAAASFADEVREREQAWLSADAVHSYSHRGRVEAEEECGLRTPFQRDRDRIVHSKAFRRLKHKTQVFIAPRGDHFRTRLTHTLETCGIARTVARALHLNEDLTEAIALGHDLGHPPFGHTGEEALDLALGEHAGRSFRHNEHSLRIIDVLENEGRGLNLIWEVRNGILHHTGHGEPSTLEGKIVRLVDRVAYLNHDIDDAIRAGILSADDLPRAEIGLLGATGGQRIDTLVHDVVEASRLEGGITQGREISRAMLNLREFMFDRVYLGPSAQRERERALSTVRRIFDHLIVHPEELPPDGVGDLAERVTDYVAGMTDRFALAWR